MNKLKKFMVFCAVWTVLIVASSGTAMAAIWFNAKSIENSAKGLPPELVISDNDETDVLITHQSLNGNFVIGSSDNINMGYLKVKNKYTTKSFNFEFGAYLEQGTPSPLYDAIWIDILNQNGQPVYHGLLKSLQYADLSIPIAPQTEQTYTFWGHVGELDPDLANESITFGLGIRTV